VKKALIFGEYKFERFLRVLWEHGYTDVVVFSAVEFDPVDEFAWATGVRIERLDPAWHVDDVVRVLETERPDVAIANPYAHGQEQLPVTYGRAAARWAGWFVTHSAEFAEVACDKVTLHETAAARGWPVPPGAVCTDATEVIAAATGLDFPLVIKEARSQAGDGRFFVDSPERLDEVLAEGLAFPAILQSFRRGVETGVELISMGDAVTRFPVISMGELDTELDPSLRARVSPYELPERAAASLDAFVADVVANLAPLGPWQVDFAVVDDDIVILEINPRLGGLSDMGLVGTGADPHTVFTASALGAPLVQVAPRTVTVELPSTEIPGSHVPPHPEGAEVMRVTARTPTNRCFVDSDRMQLVTAIGDLEAGKRWVKEVDAAGLLRCSVESAHQQLDEGFAVFNREAGS